MAAHDDEERRLRSTAMQTSASIVEARRRAEDDLARAVAGLRATLEATTDAILVVDKDGVPTEFNDRFLSVCRLTRDQLSNAKGRELVGILSSQILDPQRVGLFDIQNSELPPHGSAAFRLKDGRTIECTRAAQVVDNQTMGHVWSFRDVTDRVSAEQRLTEDITAGKRVHEDLASAAERLQLALSAGELGDWSWDARTDLMELGPRTRSIFGLTTGGPMTWKSLSRLIDEEDRERVQKAVDTALAERADTDIEFRIRRPSAPGTIIWVASKGRGAYDTDGTVLGMTGVVHDVTARKTSELSRFHLAAVVATSDDAIVTKNLGGIITTWNAGAKRMFGYDADEIVGKPVTTLIPAERHHEEREILRRLVAGERIDHFETIRIRKDGHLFPVSITVSPIRDDEGRIIGASKIARDISARVEGENALREESRMLNLLNESGKAIAGGLNLESIVQQVTDAATQLSGAEFGAFFYNTHDANGKAFQLFTLSGAPREAFEKFGHPRATPLFAPTFEGEDAIRIDDVLADSRYGQMAPFHGMPAGHLPVRSYLAAPVTSRSGEVIGGLFFGHSSPGIFTDRVEKLVVGIAAQAAIAIDNASLFDHVSRLADERQVLLEAERSARAETDRVSLMKDEFLATLSHELRTPLNAIVGWAQILRAKESKNPDIVEGLSVIDRNAKIQVQLIEDLLDMSRIISGKVRLDVQRVDLPDVVKAAIDSVQHSMDAKGIKLHVVLDPIAGVVQGDPNRLQQCVWNLLSNAIKFTPKGGKIHVSLARINSHVEITVIDTGEGIESEVLPHIFERFRQADSSSTRRYGGLGLGLSIVKNLVELHGGRVDASSAGKDKGSTFTIELPVMALERSSSGRVHPTSNSPQVAPSDHPSLAGLTVLMVDDEPDARNLVKRVLEDCGARVLLAESARQGLSVLSQEKVDVIVSDIGMPDEDGYEFIRKVRLMPREKGGRTPAAALTAFARAEDRTRALRAGYQTHVAKPVEPTELTAVVASLANRP